MNIILEGIRMTVTIPYISLQATEMDIVALFSMHLKTGVKTKTKKIPNGYFFLPFSNRARSFTINMLIHMYHLKSSYLTTLKCKDFSIVLNFSLHLVL